MYAARHIVQIKGLRHAECASSHGVIYHLVYIFRTARVMKCIRNLVHSPDFLAPLGPRICWQQIDTLVSRMSGFGGPLGKHCRGLGCDSVSSAATQGGGKFLCFKRILDQDRDGWSGPGDKSIQNAFVIHGQKRL